MSIIGLRKCADLAQLPQEIRRVGTRSLRGDVVFRYDRLGKTVKALVGL